MTKVDKSLIARADSHITVGISKVVGCKSSVNIYESGGETFSLLINWKYASDCGSNSSFHIDCISYDDLISIKDQINSTIDEIISSSLRLKPYKESK